MKLIYIAGPFRAPDHWQIHQNVLDAERVAKRLIGEGYAVICPHKMTENMQQAYPDHVFLNMCLELVRRADIIYLLEGWQTSQGSRMELELAMQLGKKVIYEGS